MMDAKTTFCKINKSATGPLAIKYIRDKTGKQTIRKHSLKIGKFGTMNKWIHERPWNQVFRKEWACPDP